VQWHACCVTVRHLLPDAVIWIPYFSACVGPREIHNVTAHKSKSGNADGDTKDAKDTPMLGRRSFGLTHGAYTWETQ